MNKYVSGLSFLGLKEISLGENISGFGWCMDFLSDVEQDWFLIWNLLNSVKAPAWIR